SPRAVWEDLLAAVGRLLRLIVEFGRGVCRRVVNIPSVPFLKCTRGYKGLWMGSGVIRVTCDCGDQQVWNIEEGKVSAICVSRMCRSYFTHAIPINPTYEGAPRPSPASWTKMAVNTGFSTYVVYERKGEKVYITGVSSPDTLVDAVTPEPLAAVMIDDIQIKPLGGDGWKQCGPFRVRVRTSNGVKLQNLPLDVSNFEPPADELECPERIPVSLYRDLERSMRLLAGEDGVCHSPPPKKVTRVMTPEPMLKRPSTPDSFRPIEIPPFKPKPKQSGKDEGGAPLVKPVPIKLEPDQIQIHKVEEKSPTPEPTPSTSAKCKADLEQFMLGVSLREQADAKDAAETKPRKAGASKKVKLATPKAILTTKGKLKLGKVTKKDDEVSLLSSSWESFESDC
nr:nonstructural protein NS5A [Hepacivirus P]